MDGFLSLRSGDEANFVFNNDGAASAAGWTMESKISGVAGFAMSMPLTSLPMSQIFIATPIFVAGPGRCQWRMVTGSLILPPTEPIRDCTGQT